MGAVSYLIRDLLLVLPGKVHKVVVFGAYQDRDGGLVEAAALAVPLLDAVQGALPGQVEHEEDGDGVVADEGQHVDELALAAEVPDAEGDLGVADADGLLHEVDAEGLDVVLVPAALDVLDHQTGLAYLGVAHHAHLDDDMVAAVTLALAGAVTTGS